MAHACACPVYEIRVRGHFGARWSEAFTPMAPAEAEGGVTVLRGQIVDQAALHGVLRRLEQSGVVLLSLTCLDDGGPDDRSGEGGADVGRARV